MNGSVRTQVLAAGVMSGAMPRVLGCLGLTVGLCAQLMLDRGLANPIQADGRFGTTVSTTGANQFVIEDGDLSGSLLIHTFTDFSVPTGGTVTFDNAPGVSTIVGRVSGLAPSIIDGLIETNEPASLYFLNPNGLILGPDAQLNIGGSFYGTTAESVQFDNSASTTLTMSGTIPTLTVSVPTGVQFGPTSQGIEVAGSGYQLLESLPVKVDSSTGFMTSPGRQLVLLGNGIELSGGVLLAPGGQVALGSIDSGFVSLTPQFSETNYADVISYSDISLSQQSLLDASQVLYDANQVPFAFGPAGGDIHIQGQNISFADGSLALIQNVGNQPWGNIQVRAAQVLQIDGPESTGQVNAGFLTNNFGSGIGGHIDVAAAQLLSQAGMNISTETFGLGAGGDLMLQISDRIVLEFTEPEKGDSGGIFVNSFGPGRGGDLTVVTDVLTAALYGISAQNSGPNIGGDVYVSANQINLAAGASIASAALGAGSGGEVLVDADVVNISGVDPITFFPTTITAATVQSGQAGDVTVNARAIEISEGGRIDASSLGDGAAGTVSITATERIDISGTVPGSINPSMISSATNAIDPALRAFLLSQGIVVSPTLTGDSGDTIIRVPTLTVRDGAEITARNDGSGNAGILMVEAGDVVVSDRARLTASTRGGDGGNIRLDIANSLVLTSQSEVSATAAGTGNGGNLSIAAPAVVAVENSDIIANAAQGQGGDILIDAIAILGTEFRPARTPESDITASSEFGVSGTVEITSVRADYSAGLVTLPEDTADDSQQMALGCAADSASQFIASGRGGIPLHPNRAVNNQRIWRDLGTPIQLSAMPHSPEYLTNPHPSRSGHHYSLQPLVEAQNWEMNDQGAVVLLSQSAAAEAQTSLPSCLR